MVHLKGQAFSANLRWELKPISDGWMESFSVGVVRLADALLIDEWTVRGDADAAVTPVFSRTLPPEWSSEKLRSYFAGNLSASPVVYSVDAQGTLPMGDAQFWQVLAQMGATDGDDLERRAADALRSLAEDEVLSWYVRLGAELSSLATPALRAALSAEPGEVRSEDAIQAMLAEVLLAGPASSERARLEPEWVLARFGSVRLAAEPLLLAAHDELARRHDASSARIVTARPPVEAPRDRPARTWRRVLDEEQRTLDITAEHSLHLPPRANVWLIASEQRRWASVRYVGWKDGMRTERIMLVAASAIPADLDTLAPLPVDLMAAMDQLARNAIESEAARTGERIEELEVLGANPAPWNGRIFQVVRRSKLSRDDYMREYRIPPPHA
ncbi:MAG: hypothetical protein QM598_02075 [Protaetiibacter sp.]